MRDSENFIVTNTTRHIVPSVPFLKIKEEVLGKNYPLSLVFVSGSKSKSLNRIYRKKNKPTNVLSFSLEKNSGELFIAPEVVKKQTELFHRKFENLVAYLFIHGILHLKGMEHGSRMERAEARLCKKFKI